MRRFVVPVDFSETSRNALRYALQMAFGLPEIEVVVFNTYDKIMAGSDGTPLKNSTGDRMQVHLSALQALVAEDNEHKVNASCRVEEGPFLPALERLVNHEKMDMVVMGINGATRLEQIMIGSSSLAAVQKCDCPVLIVPPDAEFRKIRTVIYTSDMKDVEQTTPLAQLRKILEIFQPKLYVANVNNEHYVELSEEYQLEKAKLTTMLEDFDPQYAFIRLYDFTEAINLFATDQHADLIITAPRRHGFLQNLFKTSHTERLAYHSHIPVLAIHE